MRILYICHLYPEFEESLQKGVWEPTGSREISRMIERLEHAPNIEPSFIMTHTNPRSDFDLNEDRLFKVKGFDTRFFCLNGQKNNNNLVSKMLGGSAQKRMLNVIMQTCTQIKPDIVYCDTDNIEAASVIAEKTDIPVVWRLNRMTNAMQKEPKLAGRDYRKLLNNPIAHVIATLDGSSAEEWLLRTFGDESKISLMPNGYDRNQEHKTVRLPENQKTKVLFAGPVDFAGGWRPFVKTFTHIKDEEQDKIEALILNQGNELETMKDFVKQSGVEEYFHFLPTLTTQEMKDVYLRSDMCVSMNLEGNLKDHVIAALCEGLCVIIPEPDTVNGIDIDTDTFISNDAALRYGERTNTQSLAKTILEMRRVYKRRESFAKNGQKFANQKIQTWQGRVDDEMKILENIVEDLDQQKRA